MLVTKVTCPRCGKHLRTSKPLSAGQRMLCSGCNRSFAVRPEEVSQEERPAPPSTPPPTTRPDPSPTALKTLSPAMPPARPDEEAEPRAAKAWVAVLGLGALVGGLLLLAGGIALALHRSSQKERARAEAVARAEEAPAADAQSAGPEVPPEGAAPVDLPLAPRHDPARPDAAPVKPPAPGRPQPPPRLGPDPDAQPGAPAWLPAAEQKRVNEAIDRGVEHLKRSQRNDGTWGDAHPVGMAALPGLTLLECGVPRDDPRVAAAASYVRSAVPGLGKTYELALCILFLDRLGEPGDRPLIRTMALRLIAGQTPTGGWGYDCPLLSASEEVVLAKALQKTRPASNLELFVPAPGAKPSPEFFVPGPKSLGPDLAVPRRGERRSPGLVGPDGKDGAEKPGTVAFPREPVKPDEKKPAPKPPPVRPAESLEQVHAALPLSLKRVAALTPPRLAGTFPAHDMSHTDNSNTQFAILGLWAAGRHEVPTERSLALLVKRFRFSQTTDGGWGYQYRPRSRTQTPSMTGAGLLGLAVGHGLVRSGNNAVRGSIHDPAIDRGLKALARYIGKPLGIEIHPYFLWTLERVGVLYNRRTIQKKDWYAWGARLLLERQEKDGRWNVGHYPGSTATLDTCFALLFLKRANLTQDLSQKLEFFVEGKAPEAAPPHREQK